MTAKLITAIAAALFAANTAAASAADEASDLWLEARVATLIAANEHLSPFDIDVEVDNGKAHLSGTVESDVERELAVVLARRVDGVESVTHDLRLDATGKRAAEESSLSQDVADATLTAKVKSRLLWNTHTDGLDIGVSTDDGWVTLEGQVNSSAEADIARNIALNTDGVRGVRSELTHGESAVDAAERKVSDTAAEVGSEVSDRWIEAKVTSTITFDRRFINTRLDVSAEEGVVTIEGEVDSAEQREDLLATIQTVKGVRGVLADVAVR